MIFDPGLQIGDMVTFTQLREIFKCGNAGGMLRSKTLNTLVIVLDHTKGLYEDKWVGNILHYTGMGQKGDQRLKGTQNKTLYESRTNGITVHLFEVSVPNQYVYRGIVRLVEEPYQTEQQDSEGTMRKVWIFPVQLVRDIEEIESVADERLLDSLSKIEDTEITWEYTYTGEPEEKKKTFVRNGIEVYPRNTKTALNALAYSKFWCEIDKNHPTFIRKTSNQNYVEPHHLVPLKYHDRFEVSLDIEENIVALCSNCHNCLHYGREYETLLKKLYHERKELLAQVGIHITYEELKDMYS